MNQFLRNENISNKVTCHFKHNLYLCVYLMKSLNSVIIPITYIVFLKQKDEQKKVNRSKTGLSQWLELQSVN